MFDFIAISEESLGFEGSFFRLCWSKIHFPDYALHWSEGRGERREATQPDSLSAYLGLLPPAHRLQLIITAKPYSIPNYIEYQHQQQPQLHTPTISWLTTNCTLAEANHNSQTIPYVLNPTIPLSIPNRISCSLAYYHQHTG